jgi:hypothetical protein
MFLAGREQMGAAYSSAEVSPAGQFSRMLHSYVLDLLTFHACCRQSPDRSPPCTGGLNAVEADVANLGRRFDDKCIMGFCKALNSFLRALRGAAELGTVCTEPENVQFAGEYMLARMERVRETRLGSAMVHGRSMYIQARQAGFPVPARESDWLRDVEAFLGCYRQALHKLDTSNVSVSDFEALLRSHGCVAKVKQVGHLLDSALSRPQK